MNDPVEPSAGNERPATGVDGGGDERHRGERVRGVELLLDVVRDAGDGFTLERPATVGAAGSAVGLATGPDRSRRLAPTDLQVRRADLVVVLDVGPRRGVVREDGDRARHRGRWVPAARVVGDGHRADGGADRLDRDLTLDAVRAGVDLGREPDETRRGGRGARRIQVPGTPTRAGGVEGEPAQLRRSLVPRGRAGVVDVEPVDLHRLVVLAELMRERLLRAVREIARCASVLAPAPVADRDVVVRVR